MVLIMASAKQKFAAKLLFWLLPWPISKAFPRSLRIYYFGPSGAPPGGWYDFWGQPGELPQDPYNPPDPEDLPDVPDGPVNPYNPYTPGPGADNPPQPTPPAGWITAFDDTHWQTDNEATWNVDHWDFLGTFAVSIKPTGEWSRGFRPAKWRVTHDYGPGLRLTLVNAGEPGWASACIVVSGTIYDCDFSGASDADITGAELDSGAGGCNFDITNIEFFS